MKKLIFVYIFTLICINAKTVNENQINYKLNEVQLGVYGSVKYINFYKNKYKNESIFDIYVEKKRYYLLYAVNIKNKNKNKSLEILKKDFKDAFYINKSNFNNKKNIIKIKEKEIKIVPKKESISKFEVGVNFFNNKNYKKSYTIFSNLNNENKKDKEIDFYLARSAFELNKYDESLKIYKDLLRDKKNKKNYLRYELEIARIYYLQKKYNKSKELFDKLYKLRLPINVNNNIKTYLDKLNKILSKDSYSLTALFGIANDSNVNNISSYDEFNIPNIGVFKNSSEKISSSYIHEMLLFNYNYKIKYNFYIRNDLLVYNKNYQNIDNKDLLYLSYKPSLFIFNKKFISNFGFVFNKTFYNSKDYLLDYNIFLNASYLYSDGLIYKFNINYKDKNYIQNEYKNNDSKAISSDILLEKVLTLETKVITSFLYNQELNKKDLINNIDYKEIGTSLAIGYDYSNKLNIKPKITYKEKSYKYKDTFYNIKQNSKNYNYSIDFVYLHTPSLVIQLNMNYNKIESNLKSYSYDKNIIRMNIIKRF